jgi:class 3 adenylate cyclase
MSNVEDIRSEIGTILSGDWTTRDGAQVPSPEDVQLGNNAVNLSGTVLYADLAGSTDLVNSYRNWFAAEIYKAFLRGACRVIQNNRGTITAFDGDRVMAVYIGETQNTDAVGSALEINHVVTKMINPMVQEKFKVPKFQIRHAVGIDCSPLFIARTGVRGSNDLVWVGRAANYAAKMSSFRVESITSWITPEVFNNMRDSVKYSKGTSDSPSMWEKRTWTARGIDVYCSNWMRSP